MATLQNEGDMSLIAYEKWTIVVGQNKPPFVAFVDGDPVETGSDFKRVALHAGQLRALRGPGAVLAIFDTQSGNSVI